MQGLTNYNICYIPLRFDGSSLSPRLFAGQHDTGKQFKFQCLDSAGAPVNLTGCTVRMYLSIKGRSGYIDGVTEGGALEGKVIFTIPNGLLILNGTGLLQFQIRKNSNKISTSLGEIRIEKSIEAGATIEKDVWIDWEEIRLNIEAVKNTDAYQRIEEVAALSEQVNASITQGQLIKSELGSTITSANNVRTDLNNDIARYNAMKNDLNSSITSANTAVNNVNGAVTTANEAKTTAETTKIELESVISSAESTNTKLTNTNSTANSMDSKLKTTTTNAETAKVELEQAIADGSAVSAHGHSNKEVLDKLSENQDGLLFDGQPIKGGSGVEDTGWIPVTPMNGCTLSADELSVRERNGVFYIKGGINIPSTISKGKYIALSSLIVPPLRQRGFWIQDIRSGENIFISIEIITGEGMLFEYGYNISKERMLAIPGTLIY